MSSNRDVQDLTVSRNPSQTHSFRCRLCKGYHALRKCQTFLKMDVEKRIRVVLLFNYCPNCLAHEHSSDTCFHDKGCHICSKKHHTLLHCNKSPHNARRRETNINHRGIHKSDRTQKRGSQITSTNSIDSITSIISHHMIPLLPTASVVLVSTPDRQTIRALIDVCSPYSRIAKQLADTLQLKTYKIDNEVYSQIVLSSKIDRQIRFRVDAKIVSKMPMKTPSTSISSAIISKFSHLMLADAEFYTTQGISLVLGNETCCKIFKTGVIPGGTGLPLAQDTIFGWVLSGPCAQ